MTSPSHQPPPSGQPTQPIQLPPSTAPTQPIQAPTQPIQISQVGQPSTTISSTTPAEPKGYKQHIIDFLSNRLVVAIIGALLVVIPQWISGWVSQPPDPRTLTQIMYQETQIAINYDTTLLDIIYDPQAVVTDSGCSSHNQGTTWFTRGQITARYQSLATFQFHGLKHFDPHISWFPDNAWATGADVSASTGGTMVAPDGTSTVLSGYEHWTFTYSNTSGKWLITLFTFDLCSPL